MPSLETLMKEYDKLEAKDLDTRSAFVLEMIEKIITYPPVETFLDNDIKRVNDNVNQLVKDLRRNKQYLFSVRISKVWKKREHLIQLAENWHSIGKDYMDEIEYHEEIKWLRDNRTRLVKLIREKRKE